MSPYHLGQGVRVIDFRAIYYFEPGNLLRIH
jgi:hypothetical protein